MIDQSIIQTAHVEIGQAIDEQNAELEKEIFTSQRLHADNGMLNSGVFVIAIQTLCSDACSVRAKFIWDILRRHVQNAHVTYQDGLDQQLKDIVQYHLSEDIKGLEHLMQEDAALIGNVDLMSTIPDEITNTRRIEQAKIFLEIDLFVSTLKSEHIASVNATSENISKLNQVSAMTNESTISSLRNTNQNIIEQAGYDIVNVLNTILQEVRSIDALVKYDKSEIIALIDETKAELKKSQPNFAKLQSYLDTIGNAIGATAEIAKNLRNPYISLKALMQSFNINLP